MFYRLTALAMQSVRAATRSRVLLSLFALLVLLTFSIPLTIRGDGTLIGQVRIMLQYSLALGMLVIGVGTIWSAAASISTEIESGEIRLVMVKPIRSYEVWIGKWIGLSLMSGTLLLTSAAVMAALIAHRLTAATPEDRAESAAEVFTARRPILPLPASVSDVEIAAEFAALAREGQIRPGASPDQYKDAIRQRLLSLRNVVAGGSRRSWTFGIPASARGSSRFQLRFKLSSGSFSGSDMAGTWLAAPPGRPASVIHPLASYCEGVHTLDLPATVTSAERLVLTFVNSDAPGAATAAFTGQEPVQLLVKSGSFAGNLLRALLVAWGCMAGLAALGLTAGTIFSFPVAAFVSCSVVLMLLIGHYYTTSPDILLPEGGPVILALHYAGTGIAHAVSLIGAPAIASLPVARLADGILIPTGHAIGFTLLLAFGYPLAFGLLGGWLLGRREIAVPEV